MKKHALYLGSLLLLLVALGALLLLEGPIAPVEPVQLTWPACSDPQPPLALVSIRTMNETAFLKVRGILHNRGVEPIGPLVVQGRFTSRSDDTETSAMTFPKPALIVPGAAARFELVVPEVPETAKVHITFHLLTGELLPVDGTQAASEGEGSP